MKASFVCSLCNQIIDNDQLEYHYKVHVGIWHGELWRPIKDAKTIVIGNLSSANRQCDCLRGIHESPTE